MGSLSRHVTRLDGQYLDPARTAQTVQRDFSDLVKIFDCQLANLPQSESPARSHIVRAKAAAERGLQLSEKLIEGLGR